MAETEAQEALVHLATTVWMGNRELLALQGKMEHEGRGDCLGNNLHQDHRGHQGAQGHVRC